MERGKKLLSIHSSLESKLSIDERDAQRERQKGNVSTRSNNERRLVHDTILGQTVTRARRISSAVYKNGCSCRRSKSSWPSAWPSALGEVEEVEVEGVTEGDE